jgi:hypothetical protein
MWTCFPTGAPGLQPRLAFVPSVMPLLIGPLVIAPAKCAM